jgi:hypothetical protein
MPSHPALLEQFSTFLASKQPEYRMIENIKLYEKGTEYILTISSKTGQKNNTCSINIC